MSRRASTNLARLLDAGFDIASWNRSEDPAYDRPGGAASQTGMRSWARSGRRAGSTRALRRQPVAGERVFAAGTLTAYAEDWAPRLLDALEGAADHGSLLERLREAGLQG